MDAGTIPSTVGLTTTVAARSPYGNPNLHHESAPNALTNSALSGPRREVPLLTHQDPSFWADPEAFQLQRFLCHASTSVPRDSYFPFGGGGHRCIAERFALMEAQLVLAAVVSRFDFLTSAGSRIPPVPGIALLPKRSPAVTFRSRP